MAELKKRGVAFQHTINEESGMVKISGACSGRNSGFALKVGQDFNVNTWQVNRPPDNTSFSDSSKDLTSST
jgi:hypothetical protein